MAITNTPNEVVHQAYKSDKRSWFAQKHTHLSSYQPGYVHPDLVVPITGNTTVKLNMSRYLQSAPTVTPVFDSMRVNFRVFFAPQRLYTRGLYGNNFEEVDKIESIEIPRIIYGGTDESSDIFVISRGSLLNRLGMPAGFITAGNFYPLDKRYYSNLALTKEVTDFISEGHTIGVNGFNATPLCAYYDIWNHYIRNPYVKNIPSVRPVEFDEISNIVPDHITNPRISYNSDDVITNAILGVRGVSSSGAYSEVYDVPFYIVGADNSASYDLPTKLVSEAVFGNRIAFMDKYVGDISQPFEAFLDAIQWVTPTGMLFTNYGEHYQTMFYDDEEIESILSINLGDNIESLRLGKSVWNRALRTILRGRKYTDWIDVQFGNKLKLSDHPIFVGSDSMLVSFQDVLNQTAPKTDGDPALGKAAGAGARGGKNADSERTIVFTAQEPGYLMVLVDFVPEVSYTSVLPRWAEYETMSSFPMPAYSGRTFQDLKVSDLCYIADPFLDVPVGDAVIGKQPLYFDYMSSYNRSSALFATEGFAPYTFQRTFDLSSLESQIGSNIVEYVQSTYILPTMFDSNFADVGQNGRQNFWMKTEYNLRLFMPLEKQVVSGRI